MIISKSILFYYKSKNSKVRKSFLLSKFLKNRLSFLKSENWVSQGVTQFSIFKNVISLSELLL